MEHALQDSSDISHEQHSAPLKLHYSEDDRDIMITDQDGDRWFSTVKKARESCRRYEDNDEFSRQFKDLLYKLSLWVDQNQAVIKDAYMSMRDTGLLFLVCQQSVEHLQEFESLLTDLDVSIAHDKNFDKVNLSVMSIPNCSPDAIQTFISEQYLISLPLSYVKN